VVEALQSVRSPSDPTDSTPLSSISMGRTALVGLIQTLAHPAQVVIVLPVHRELWACCSS